MGYRHPGRMLRDLTWPELCDWLEVVIMAKPVREEMEQAEHAKKADLIKQLNQASGEERERIWREFSGQA